MQTLQIMKNTEAAGNYGSMFGQDVEPSGTYVLERDKNAILLEGWISGVANLKNPLYIDIDYDTQISYKRDLSDKYKAKGKRLTNKLMKEGYDAIITRYPKGFTGEIVLFPNADFSLSSTDKKIQMDSTSKFKKGGRLVSSYFDTCLNFLNW